MNEAELKAMPLHERITINKSLEVWRVLNGWIYYKWFQSSITSTFVPEVLPIIQHIEPRK